MKITNKVIELNEANIRQILIGHLQDKDFINDNVPNDDINIREVDGEIKCTITIID